MAVTWPAKNNYATGDVLTAANMNGIGDDLNDIQNQSFFAGKNKIINGDFGIWQRGTSFAFTATQAGYTADRFTAYVGNTGAGTISQQTFTAGTAPVAGYEGKFFLRFNETTNSGNQPSLIQRIEGGRTFANQQVTISFWAKVNSGLTTGNITLTQNFGTGGSPSTAVDTIFSSGATITTSWVRYSYTATLPSVAGKTFGTNNDDYLALTFNLPAGSTYSFDLWGVQVEAGSVATVFQTATGTKQGELAACQRYYFRTGGDTTYQATGNGIGQSATAAMIIVQHPVQMRTAASSVDYSTLAAYDGTNLIAATSLSIIATQKSSLVTSLTLGTAGSLTQYRPYTMVSNNSTSAYVGLNAEL